MRTQLLPRLVGMVMVAALVASVTHDTLLAAPANASTTVTFDDLGGQNVVLNGQYPSGAIDWGTNKWFLSGPSSDIACAGRRP